MRRGSRQTMKACCQQAVANVLKLLDDRMAQRQRESALRQRRSDAQLEAELAAQRAELAVRSAELAAECERQDANLLKHQTTLTAEHAARTAELREFQATHKIIAKRRKAGRPKGSQSSKTERRHRELAAKMDAALTATGGVKKRAYPRVTKQMGVSENTVRKAHGKYGRLQGARKLK